MKVKSESEVTQSRLTLRDPRDCSLPGSSVYGIFQARVLEWVAIAFSVKHIYFCFIDYTKAFVCVDHNKLWKILKELEIPDPFTCLLRNLYGTTDWFQIRKGVHQSCILSCRLFNFMQSVSCEMPGWVKNKLESRSPGEISITSDIHMTPPLWQKMKKN